MRVTDAMHLEKWMRSLRTTSVKLEKAQISVSSGKSLLKPSDDPSGIGQVVQIKSNINKIDQYINAIDDGLGWMKTTESTLSLVSDLVANAKQIALDGITATVSEEQRQAMAHQVGQVIEQVVALSNTQYAGKYIFSGEIMDVKPFSLNDSKTGIESYAGGNGSVNRQIMSGSVVVVNSTGQEAFIDSGVFDSLFSLKQGLESNDFDALSASISDLDNAFKEVVSLRGVVGTKISHFESVKDQHELQKDYYEGIVGELEEGDIIEMIASLQIEQTAYEAALAVGAQINSISLVDFL